jgi:hypothetical protein
MRIVGLLGAGLELKIFAEGFKATAHFGLMAFRQLLFVELIGLFFLAELGEVVGRRLANLLVEVGLPLIHLWRQHSLLAEQHEEPTFHGCYL